MFQNVQESKMAFDSDLPQLNEKGVYLLGSTSQYVLPQWRKNYNMALDAQPALSTTANAGIPAFLTTLIDPDVFEVLFAPNKAAEIFGENRKGNWLDETMMFPMVEQTGEVSSYGDFADSGHTGVNTNFPQRQSYLFQTVKEYGDRELERAGLARINFVSEIDKAAATVLGKFTNLSYFFGIAGMQNYGLLNDPNLTAALTPATKAAGGVKWIIGTVMNATANEVYSDLQSLYLQLVNQNTGLVDQNSQMTLAMSPGSAVALTITNAFGVNVEDLLKKNFPNLKVVTAVQYGAISAINPQGVAAGNMVQLFVDNVEGQDVGYCSFNEKMRAHPIIRQLSSYKQKVTGGTWGAIIRQPSGIAQMVGV